MGINLQAIRSAKLKARAQLLNLSEIITPWVRLTNFLLNTS
jgi:hypothetical protein